MEIIRNTDGSLLIPVPEGRHHDGDDEVETPTGESVGAPAAPTTRLLHRAPAVSTASGREEAMNIVHALAESPDHDVAFALKDVRDAEASGEALRLVLIGGTHSVEAFSQEVADAEGGEPLPAHKMTKIIGEVLAELDK